MDALAIDDVIIRVAGAPLDARRARQVVQGAAERVGRRLATAPLAARRVGTVRMDVPGDWSTEAMAERLAVALYTALAEGS